MAEPSPPDDKESGTVGLLFESEEWGRSLREALVEAGVEIAFEQKISSASPDDLRGVDTLVVNLDSALDERLTLMDHLFALTDCKVIFNDPASAGDAADWSQSRWARHLLAKVLGRPAAYPPAPDKSAASAVESLHSVWVLGASIGGPEAIRTFLNGLPHTIPAAFVLAQHMGEEFLDLMTNQLTRACGFQVRRARHGERLHEGQVVVAPVDRGLEFDAEQRVRLTPPQTDSPYTPCIDDVVRSVASQFGSRTGLIIFSGMASDAVEGAVELAAMGGDVWAQSPESCVVSSMVEGAIAAGVVTYTGAPEALAAKLVQRYEGHSRPQPHGAGSQH